MNEHNAPLIKQLLGMGELRPLVETALKLQNANLALQSVLQEPFKGEVTVGQLEQGCITLDVPNASMLTILRYQTSDILRQLRQIQGLAGIASIKCRVKPPISPLSSSTGERFATQNDASSLGPEPLSAEAKKTLKSTAERITDPALQAILLKLSER
jgi:hypothetical protein